MTDLSNVPTKDLKESLKDLLLIVKDEDITPHERNVIRNDIRKIRRELMERG